MVKNKRIKRITAGLLAGIMVFLLAACGKEEGNKGGESGTNSENSESSGGAGGTQNTGGKTDDGDYVYVPRFYDLPVDTEADSARYGSVSLEGSRLYCVYTVLKDGKISNNWCYVDMNNPDAAPVVLMDLTEYAAWTEDSATDVVMAAADKDGGTILLLQISPLVPMDATDEELARQQRDTAYSIKKLAEDGTEIFDSDVTEYLKMDMNNTYPQQMFADEEGNIYISNGASYVWVFDKEGNHVMDIDLSRIQGYVAAVNILPDGRLGVAHQGNGMQIEVFNPDTRQFSETYTNLPSNCYNSNMAAGPNGGVLLNGNSSLYEYSLETQEYTELIKWMDCDLNSNNIRDIATLEDGRIAVYSSDWSAGTDSLILLERMPASEVTEKETLTLGCMNLTSNLQAAVVEFNKESDKYKIEIKNYGESVDYSVENAYEDARTLFYNDILTGKAPDMFLAEDIDMKLFAVKGLIEDLSPYLDGSTVVQRGDLFETILNAYTINGTLCAIPRSFSVQTLAGRTSEVGTESGWTLQEMIAFAEAHPDILIQPYASKMQVLSLCMMFDFDSWVNWETGECSFDTPEFKAVLEFANRYPAQADESLPSAQQQIMEHTALLHDFGLNDPRSWQLERIMFGEPITAIGYPSAHSNGVLAFGDCAVCISTASPNKEAAWSFIETLLTEEAQDDEMIFNFPVRVSAFEKRLAEAMVPEYMYDENGEPLLDENGNPKEVSRYSYGWQDGLVIEVYAVTQEEADGIRHVISQIDGIYSYDRNMVGIILEEIAPYFEGQKSVDEVAGIIQSRVQLYINESR